MILQQKPILSSEVFHNPAHHLAKMTAGDKIGLWTNRYNQNSTVTAHYY